MCTYFRKVPRHVTAKHVNMSNYRFLGVSKHTQEKVLETSELDIQLQFPKQFLMFSVASSTKMFLVYRVLQK